MLNIKAVKEGYENSLSLFVFEENENSLSNLL